MTILVWDGKCLATDKQASIDIIKRKTEKAWEIRVDGQRQIVSGVGVYSYIVILREWYKQGAAINNFPYTTTDDHALIVVKQNGLYVYDASPYPDYIGTEQRVFGNGSEIALGALAMGADAKKAVEIVNEHCVYCGLGVDVFSL